MMKEKRKGFIVSCFQCAGIAGCFGNSHPEINRDEARQRASVCTSLRKGSPVEKVYIEGYTRGISRKKAEKLVSGGKAHWVSFRTINLQAGFPGEKRSRYSVFTNRHNGRSRVTAATPAMYMRQDSKGQGGTDGNCYSDCG